MSVVSSAAQPKPCNACDATASREPVYVVKGYTIERCSECGLGSTAIASGFDPGSLYEESYFQGGQKDGYADYLGSERVLRREFRSAVNLLRRRGQGSGKLLEIGCAFGFFLEEAGRYFACKGLEVSEAAARSCQERGLDVSQGHADLATIAPLGHFDAAVMLDVIEHLPDPRETLEAIHSVLNPGASLVISTGDWGSVSARLLGRRWRLMTPPQHLFFFTRPSLRRLLESTHFEVISLEAPWKSVPLGLAAYQLGNRIGLRIRPLEKCVQIAVPINLFDTIRVIARRR